jgi:insertion element IS1 protein InsB
MKCPNCTSQQISKDGHRRGKQNYICRDCGRQFIESYSHQGYSEEIKARCLRMYVNGSGFRAIERVTGVNHNTVINWVKSAAQNLPPAPSAQEIPEITQVDGQSRDCRGRYERCPHELETYVRRKKDKIWLWTAANKRFPPNFSLG